MCMFYYPERPGCHDGIPVIALFSFLFIRLTRYADGRCNVPVNLILDEFNNVGRIGEAEDESDFARFLSVVRLRDIRVMLVM